MKKEIIVTLGLIAALAIAGCANQTAGNTQAEPAQEQAAETEQPAEAEQTTETEQAAEPAQEQTAGTQTESAGMVKYESKDGWSTSYDSSLIEVTEDDGVVFSYKGDAEGVNRVHVNYYEGEMPDEVLYNVMAGENGLPEHKRSEDYFAGRTDVWSMRTSMASNTVKGATEDFIAVERNGGTLLIQITTSEQADEGKGIAVSDALAAVVDSFELADQQPQTYGSGVPGKYIANVTDEIEGEEVSAEYYVQFNEDHTGVIHMQDDVQVIWYSRDGVVLSAETGEQIYEYNVEGDSLYLRENEEDDFMEFVRDSAK